jgi:post-segregation antitoxin (ccd killing protein)
MNHLARGPKRPVNLTLSEDVVREARLLTRNLSETVESLLVAYVTAEREKQAERERRIDNTIEMANAHYQTFGIIGEEFSPV